MDIIETIKSLLTSNHSDQQIVTALSSSSLQSGLQCAAVCCSNCSPSADTWLGETQR